MFGHKRQPAKIDQDYRVSRVANTYKGLLKVNELPTRWPRLVPRIEPWEDIEL